MPPTAPAPAPISLPTRALLPPRPLAVGLFALGTAAIAVTVLRPKNVPPQVQVGADLVTATVVGIHPFETLAVRHYLRRRELAPRTRLVTLASSLVYGVFGSVPALRAIHRARR